MKAPVWAWGLVLLSASPAWGQSTPGVTPHPEVKNLKVVVPTVRGNKRHGRSALTRGLRSAFARAVDTSPSPTAFSRAQRKLPRQRRLTPAGLARAARAAGADYVVDVAITKKGWLYTARALLVRASDGLIQMDFRSQYYKPKSEAADRGRRIAARTLEKLEVLRQDGLLPRRGSGSIAATPPSPSGSRANQVRSSSPPEARSPSPPPRAPTPAAELDPALNPSAVVEPPPSAAPSPPPVARLDDEDEASASASVERVASPRPRRPQERKTVFVSVTAGAGVLRSYTLDSNAGRSGLSFSLDPIGLVDLRGRFLIAFLELDVRGAVRPVQYNLTALDGSAATPQGLLFDGRLALGWHLKLSQTWSLTPAVGARAGISSVDEHVGPTVLDTTAITTFLALSTAVEITTWLELRGGFEGGLLVAYEESPTQTGSPGLGFTVAGDLGFRFWLTKVFGLALDNRFVYDAIDFSGEGDRGVPPGEARLQEARLNVRDLRSSLGVEVRF